jgi:8-oxo-dGTP diphosphatase
VYLAFVQAAQVKPRAGDDAADARWWSIDALPDTLAFDHADILELARKRLAEILELAGGMLKWIPGEVTLAELRSVHDQIHD